MPKLKTLHFVRRKKFRRLRPPPSPIFGGGRSILSPPLLASEVSGVSDLVYNEPLLETALCELSLRKFVESAWKVIEPQTEFVGNWHIDAICEHLEAISKRQILRLIINIPPRHCKSLAVAVFYPAWDWINSPAERNIYASYASTLSERDNIKFGRLIRSNWYQERWADRFKLVADTQVKIENNKGGYRIATSVGGVATGEGGTKIIADDPHNVRDVSSEAKRVGALLWWDEVMSSRLDNPKTGIRLIIMQRSHENDLTGHLLSKETKYDYLCLPARYEGNRCNTKLNFIDSRTIQGEALWKGKFGEEELLKLESELGEYASAGQLQQRPTPRGGGMFKVRNLLIMQSYAPDYIQTAVRFWDKAGTKDAGAYTCGALLLKTKDKKYIIADIVRGQWDASVRESKIKLTTQTDFAEMRKNRIKYTVWIEQEPGSGGKESAQSTVRNLAGFPIYAEKPTGKKEIRAEPFSCQVNMGNVGILERGWMQECMDKLEFYPATKYKDWGDALGGAFNKLNNPKRSGVWGKKQSEN